MMNWAEEQPHRPGLCPSASGEAPGMHDIRFRGGCFQFKLKQVLQRTAPSDCTGEHRIWGLRWGAEDDGSWLGGAGPGPTCPCCRNF